jgi:type IV pilus assembly protein PilW
MNVFEVDIIMGRRLGKHAVGQAGFSLIEVLVGMAIGLLAVIVAMQVFSVSEASKRSTTGGADAATNGATALYLVEREAAMAGWGLESSLYLGRTTSTTPVLPGCATLNHYCSGNANCKDADWSLAPISITDGGSGPDTITIRYFSNPDSGNFVPATTGRAYSNTLDAGSVPQLKVSSNFGCKKGDLVLVADPTGSACTLIQVSADPVTTPGSTTLPHKSDATAASSYNDPAWDPANGVLPTISSNVTLATCFTPAAKGPSSSRTYAVDAAKGLLLRSDTIAGTVGEATTDGIVDMQAQYGVAADGAQTVSSWVDATTASSWDSPVPMAGTAGSTTSNRLQNIKAVRIALLARSGQYEKPTGSTCDATTGTPGTAGSSGWSSWATFDTSKYPSDWKCYRYRAFEVVIPVRNVIWGNS